MAHASFEQSIFIAVPPSVVHRFLSTLHEHPKIHPLIIRIDQAEPTPGPDGRPIDHYRVRDRMKLGPMMIQFTYRVDMSVTNANEIVSDAYQSPRIHLHNVTTCQAEGNGTRLHEHVDITAPALLMKTVHQQGSQSHQEMFANLKRLLETGEARVDSSARATDAPQQ
jgi:hypothetical protein